MSGTSDNDDDDDDDDDDDGGGGDDDSNTVDHLAVFKQIVSVIIFCVLQLHILA
jgi:hypothetical protein